MFTVRYRRIIWHYVKCPRRKLHKEELFNYPPASQLKKTPVRQTAAGLPFSFLAALLPPIK